MNTMKSILAVSVLALSSAVSAQIVYVPEFPTTKMVSTETVAETQAPASEVTPADKAA